jgi:hypothetical protein
MGSCLGVKWLGHDNDHSPLLPLDDCGVERDNFTFTLPRNILFPLEVNASTEWK